MTNTILEKTSLTVVQHTITETLHKVGKYRDFLYLHAAQHWLVMVTYLVLKNMSLPSQSFTFCTKFLIKLLNDVLID